VFAQTSGILHLPTTLGKPFPPTFSKALKPARLCGKVAHSMSSPTELADDFLHDFLHDFVHRREGD
jgi:hypothetical protein